MPSAPILYFLMTCVLLTFTLELQPCVASNLCEGGNFYDMYTPRDSFCCVLLFGTVKTRELKLTVGQTWLSRNISLIPALCPTLDL